MASIFTQLPNLFLTVFVCTVLFVVYLISKAVKDSTMAELAEVKLIKERNAKMAKRSCATPLKSSKKRNNQRNYRSGKDLFNHEWLLTTLKGHSSTILDMEFSPNGKYLATCGEDRAILLWYTQDWFSKIHKNFRVNVNYDYASLIRWTPDSKAFIIKRERENIIQAYKVNRAKGVIRNISPILTYPRLHNDDIIGLGISANGKYIMTSSNKTDIAICDLKGNILSRVNSYVAVNYSTYLSPCGKYMIASGFVPDARIWHIQLKDSGEFVNCTRLFDLKGHNSGIYDTSFDSISSKVATISKDGTWKLFDISVGIDKKDPVVLATGTYEQEEISRLALSPLGDVIAVTSGSNLSLYDTNSAKLDIIIRDIFPGVITRVLFDSEGKYVLVCGTRQVRIFHNITGIKASAEVAKAKLKQRNNTSALNERLRQQISIAEAFLASYTSEFVRH